MNVTEFLKLLRTRWVTVLVSTAAMLLLAFVYILMTTPLYEAATRLFVSSTAGASASDLYEGNRLSQDRVLSYAELLEGQTLAQRTIDKLDLAMSSDELQARVKAASKLDTVLIQVKVVDASPVRARDIANALSDEFVVMVKELETPHPGARPDARVVVEQRASIPQRPVAPKKLRTLGIGLILGLALGIGLAVLRDLLDNTVKTRESIEAITGAGVVGFVPMSKDRRNQPAIAFDKDVSATAEAFRKLRTNLQFLHVDDPPRVIVVTSSIPSEGKSTTAINIALALAESDQKVVLVDGDMRRPSLSEYLNVVGSVGFSTVLSGGASLSEVLQTTKFRNLSVLAAGGTPPNPSELLGSLAAKKVLAELRSQFDYVILDSAPLLAVTDSAILAASADGALMMVKFGHTRRDQLAHAVGNLKDVGVSLLGAVFTMTPARGTGSYSYSYSYYGNEKQATTRNAEASGVAGGTSVSTNAEANNIPLGVPD